MHVRRQRVCISKCCRKFLRPIYKSNRNVDCSSDHERKEEDGGRLKKIYVFWRGGPAGFDVTPCNRNVFPVKSKVACMIHSGMVFAHNSVEGGGACRWHAVCVCTLAYRLYDPDCVVSGQLIEMVAYLLSKSHF
jgi:hypothetical protein